MPAPFVIRAEFQFCSTPKFTGKKDKNEEESYGSAYECARVIAGRANRPNANIHLAGPASVTSPTARCAGVASPATCLPALGLTRIAGLTGRAAGSTCVTRRLITSSTVACVTGKASCSSNRYRARASPVLNSYWTPAFGES
jgi:hypothetical protein